MGKEQLRAVIEGKIAENQQTIVSRWEETLKYYWHGPTEPVEENEDEDEFVSIDEPESFESVMKLLLFTACLIAYADFEVSVTKSTGETEPFEKPSAALRVADYLSHGGYLIIDSKQLDPTGHRTLRQIYGKSADGYVEGFSPTVSTRALRRNEREMLTEGTSLTHAAIEQLKRAVNAASRAMWNVGETAKQWGIEGPERTDYGLDLLVGGAQGISAQFVAHHSIDSEGHLSGILLGLEEGSSPEGERPGEYTAAHSLQFKNLLYRLKFLTERQELVPKACNGMRVVLSKEKYQLVHQQFEALQNLSANEMYSAFHELLTSFPSSVCMTDTGTWAMHDKYMILFDEETSSSIHTCVSQVSSVLPQPIDSSLSSHFGALLTDIKPWIAYFLRAEPLPAGDRSTRFLPESEQTNIAQLSRALNETVSIIRKRAVQEIRRIRDEAKELKDIHAVFNRYEVLRDARKLDEKANVFQKLQQYINNKNHFDKALYQYLLKLEQGEPSEYSSTFFQVGQSDPGCPLWYLTELHQLKREAYALLSTNESQIILELLQAPVPMSRDESVLIPEEKQKDSLTC